MAPGSVVKVATGLLTFAGFITALCGVQLLISLTFFGALRAVPYVMIALGAGGFFAGVRMHKMRSLTAVLGGVVAASIAVFMGGWSLYAAAHGLFSLLGAVVVPIAAAATMFAGLSIGPTRRAVEARRRLEDAGIDLGI